MNYESCMRNIDIKFGNKLNPVIWLTTEEWCWSRGCYPDTSSLQDNQRWQLSRSSDRRGHQTGTQLSLNKVDFFFGKNELHNDKMRNENILLSYKYSVFAINSLMKATTKKVLQCAFDLDLIKHMTKTYKLTRSFQVLLLHWLTLAIGRSLVWTNAPEKIKIFVKLVYNKLL